jgi:hypothetical protein
VGRIIGVPGDTVKRESATSSYFSIKPAGQSAYVEEKSASQIRYTADQVGTALNVKDLNTMLPAGLEVHLGQNEFFLAFDNRDTLSGSIVWGPVPLEQIVGSVFLVYWPFSRIGTTR